MSTLKRLRIVTPCTTTEEFDDTFRTFCKDRSIFIPTTHSAVMDERLRFSITLQDATLMIAGSGRVSQWYTAANSPFVQAGMVVEFSRLDTKGRERVKRLSSEREIESARAQIISSQSSLDGGAGPGAIMPANPFGTVSGTALRGFIDCMLQEEEGDADDSEFDLLTPVRQALPAEAVPVIESPGTLPPSAPSLVLGTAQATSEGARATGKGHARHWPLLAMLLIGGAGGYMVSESLQADKDTTTSRPVQGLSLDRATPEAVADSAIAMTDGKGDSSPTQAKSEDDKSASPTHTEPADDDSASPPAAEPADDNGASPPAAEPAECEALLAIKSSPSGATIHLGETNIGNTPIRTKLPCGEATLNAQRRRYQDQAQTMQLKSGKNTLFIKMERPTHSLEVSSVPPGATVHVDKRIVGKSPLQIPVRGFRRTKVRLVLDGHRSWSKEISTRKNPTVVRATLEASSD